MTKFIYLIKGLIDVQVILGYDKTELFSMW